MNQVGCRSIPLETVGEERVRATQRFWLVFRLPLLSLQGSRASAALVVVRARPGLSYVLLSLAGWPAAGGCSGCVPAAVLMEFRVLLNQEFFAAWISFIRAPL